MYKKFFKRVFDIILSLLIFIIIVPFFIVIAILIKITSKGPIFFRQKRIGKGKYFFTIYKFRTMRIDTPNNIPTHMLENSEQYITKIGKFLRKTSLDEVPQIINIIKGNMSFIGPRPALYNQDDLIAERDKYNANSIRPGLTGLAQVSGRDTLPIPIKAEIDGEYFKKCSFIFDLKIFFLTIISVLNFKDIKEGKAIENESIHNNVNEDDIIEANEDAENVNQNIVTEEDQNI